MRNEPTPAEKDQAFLERLPPLFREIVWHARRSAALCSRSVVSFDEAKQMLRRKRELAQHVERAYFKPRGNAAG